MKFIALTVIIFCSSLMAKANESKRIAYGFVKMESEKDPNLTKQEAQFVFTLYRLNGADRNAKITYSIDGAQYNAQLKDAAFSVKTTPGKHVFQVFINPNYYEIYSDSLEITGGYTDKYNVYVQEASIEVIMDKPVIYLYPEKEQKVSIKLDIDGEMLFTYPVYQDGWNVTAHPNGTIDSNGKSFNYLFWEAKHEIQPADIDLTSGFIIQNEDVQPFIEQILKEAQFTSKEKADFITYWVPRMIQYDLLFIQFIQNEECDQFAKLTIEPRPESIARFYMNWISIDEAFEVKEQTILPINRSGFTVLEWGGQQIKR